MINRINSFFIALVLLMFLFSCSESEKQDNEKYFLIRKKLTLIDKMGPSFMQDFGKNLYNAVLEGKIIAYNSDSLSEMSKMTKEMASKAGSTEEMIQFIPDPSYPDYYIDSLITNKFTPDRIEGFEISAKCTRLKNAVDAQLSLHAFAIRYEPLIGGIKLKEQALFWIKYQDLKNLMSKRDFDVFSSLVLESLSLQASDY